MAVSVESGPTAAVPRRQPSVLHRARHWLSAATFAPLWLSGRWRHPLVGYVGSVGAVIAAVVLDALLGLALPGFAYPTSVGFLAVLGVAVTWGFGPAMLASALASALLHASIISSHLPVTTRGTSDAVAFVVFFIAGVVISLVASQAEGRRRLLAVQRNRLQQVLDVLPEGILIADANPPTVAAMNAAAAEFLGVDVVGESVPIPPPGARGEFAARHLDGTPYPLDELPLERALLRGDVVRGDRFLIRNAAHGREIAILASSAPLRDDEGLVDGAVEVFQDISAIRDLERQREELLATVSHDLKNPLSSIRGTSQVLLRRVEHLPEADRQRFAEGLEIIARTAKQMATQIEELLDITRAQMGRPLPLDMAATDVAALLARVVDEHQRATERHTVYLRSAPECLVSMVDAARLQRALDNLLANAIKYSPQGGEVHAAIACADDVDGSWIIISITDSGLGIPSAEVARIFERYYRASNVAGQIAGSGLGLASTQQIVEQHGGCITVESAEGIGTTVTVRLPLRRPPVETI